MGKPFTPEELAAMGLVDPYEGEAAPAPDPYQGVLEAASRHSGPAPIREGQYGPQTTGQMAAPDAPMYLPPSPPSVPTTKGAYSATDSQDEAFGKEVRKRDPDAELATLRGMRQGATPYQAPQGPGQNEARFDSEFSGNDARAREAFILNWMAGGPEQAYKFQEAYQRQRDKVSSGRNAARDKDTALAQGGEPISDAQAETLARTYGMTPEAAANMTRRQWDELSPILKSSPYTYGQQQGRGQATDLKMMELLQRQHEAEGKNAARITDTQLKGQTARDVAGIRKKSGGGGGPGKPRDVTDVLAASAGASHDAAAEALRKVANGERATSDEEERLMVAGRVLQQQSGKVYGNVTGRVVTGGTMQQANTEHGAEVRTDAKRNDPAQRTKIGSAFRTQWASYQAAARAFKQLEHSGKLDLLVKAPYGRWNAIIDSQLSGADQDAARAISAFINPEMRKQTGAALSEFERDMSFSQFGIQATANPFASPDRLRGFLSQSRDMIMQTKAAIDQEYPNMWGGAQ
jgi:hypothetical protein